MDIELVAILHLELQQKCQYIPVSRNIKLKMQGGSVAEYGNVRLRACR